MDVPMQASSKARTVSAKDVYNRVLGMVKQLRNGILQKVSQTEYTTLQTVSTTSVPTPTPTTTMEVEPTEFEDKATTPSAILTSSPAAGAEEVPQAITAIDAPTPASMTTLIPRNSLHNRLLDMVKMLSSKSRASAGRQPLTLKHGPWADRITTEAETTYPTSSPAAEAEGPGQAEEVSTAMDVPTPAPWTTSVTGNDPYSRLRNMVKILSLRSRKATDGRPIVFRSGTSPDRITTEAETTYPTSSPAAESEGPGQAEEVSTAMDVPTPSPLTTSVTGYDPYSRLRNMVKILSLRSRAATDGRPIVFRSGTSSGHGTLQALPTSSPPPTTTIEVEPTELEDIVTTPTAATTTTLPPVADTDGGGRAEEAPASVSIPTSNPWSMTVPRGRQGLYNRLLGMVNILSMRREGLSNGHRGGHRETDTTPTTTTTTTTTTTPSTEEPLEAEDVLTSTTTAPVTTGAAQGGQGVYSRLMHVFRMLSARNRNTQAATTTSTTTTTTTTTTEEPPEEEEAEEAGGSQDYEYEY